MTDHSAPDYELAATRALTEPAQYRALFEPTRSQIVSLLLDRAATTSELAEILRKPKGTIGFHLKSLEAAGLVRVVRTRRVRALEAKYYGRTARVFLFETVGAAEGAMAGQLRQAADEAAAVPADTDLPVNGGVRYARIPAGRAQAWTDRVHALLDEFDREPRVGEQTFGLVVGIYPTDRPRLSAGPVAAYTTPGRDRARRSPAARGPGGTTRITGPGAYRRLLVATGAANLADGLQVVAVPWLASVLTRDPVQIALVAAATRLPWLLFSLPVGAITDRFDRRRLIAWADTARTGLLLAFALLLALSGTDGTGGPQRAGLLLAALYVLALLVGAAEVLGDNSSQTLMPSIVSKERLEVANGRLWAVETVANQFVGPPLAGLLIAAGMALPFFVGAGSFALAAVVVFTIAGHFRPPVDTGRGPGCAGRSGRVSAGCGATGCSAHWRSRWVC